MPQPEQSWGSREQLSAVESARHAAVASTRRPTWLNAGLALTVGAALAAAMLRTPTGLVVGASLFGMGIVGFIVIDRRLRRRRGGLLKVNGRSILAYIAVYTTVFVLGQSRPPATWQPWFALAAGVLIAGVTYIYLRWDDADTAKRLASGDFDSGDLMP